MASAAIVILMEMLVRLFSDRGELIVDPFAGSGTTGVAAIRQGGRFVGWEMYPHYAAIAARRLAAAREQTRDWHLKRRRSRPRPPSTRGSVFSAGS
jgi:DNA modification methylase